LYRRRRRRRRRGKLSGEGERADRVAAGRGGDGVGT
jgi:hypothetical protein